MTPQLISIDALIACVKKSRIRLKPLEKADGSYAIGIDADLFIAALEDLKELICSVCHEALGDAIGTCLCLPSCGSYHPYCNPHTKANTIEADESVGMSHATVGGAREVKKKADVAADIVVNQYGDAMKNLAGKEWWKEKRTTWMFTCDDCASYCGHCEEYHEEDVENILAEQKRRVLAEVREMVKECERDGVSLGHRNGKGYMTVVEHILAKLDDLNAKSE